MLKLKTMDEMQISQLYAQSMMRDFPPNELKTLSAILHMYRRNQYDVLGAYMDDRLVAYALVYRPSQQRTLLLDYLAVMPEHRGCGIGTALLRQLRMHYSDTSDALMIECERPKAAPDEEEARRRIRFYTFAGAMLTSVRIWLFGVEYSILVLPCRDTVPQQEWASLMLSLYRSMLPRDLYQQNVRLIRE